MISKKIFLSILLPIVCQSIVLPNDDLDIIRQRVLEIAIWPTPDQIPIIAKSALLYSNTLNSSCYWPDINYTNPTEIGPWDLETHILRVTTMVQAVTVNGSSVKNDPKILANAHCALHVWLVNDWENPNWWFNEIGIPLQLTSQLLMLGDNVTSFEVQKITEISYRADWWLPSPPHVGANVIWEVQVEIYRSLATRNLTGIEQGFSRIWQEAAFSNTTVSDVQRDWSYHMHDFLLYSGGYGLVWINNILLFLECSQNTKYEPTDEVLLFLGNFLIQGDAWMIMTNKWDYHVLGRGIAWPDDLGPPGLATNWIRTLAKLIKQQDLKIELNNFADRLDNKPDAPPFIGNKHFYMSDYQVHRRANWMASIKVQSAKTFPTECILFQNQKAEHAGQGVLNLYKPGTADYFNIFPILDWQAINGITVEHDIPLELCDNGLFFIIRRSFVGGVSDGQYGLTMMDTATHNLTAQRSWHFYDDAIIALATNINLTTPTTGWTTLASRLVPTGKITVGFFNSTICTLDDGNYSFSYVQNQTLNVQWIHVGGSDIGYLLQLQEKYASLVLQIGVKTGNYKNISRDYDFTVTARMLTLAIDHGVGPYSLNYNYMIIPNVSLESMPRLIEQYKEEQVFACMSTNTNFHGTMWPTLKRASFVLWSDIETIFSCKSPTFEINIQLSHSGAYIFSETETDFTLTVSHPIQWNMTLHAVVDRVGYGQGCATSSYIDATVTNMTIMLPPTRALLDTSVSVTCKKTFSLFE
jgi:chondroitin AC lyase